jgi:hypothetical protein
LIEPSRTLSPKKKKFVSLSDRPAGTQAGSVAVNGKTRHFAHIAPAIFPEMITPQDGAAKQDSERNAGKRWLNRWSPLFAPQSITYLGDDLFCNQPFCEAVIAHQQYFIFVCKPDSHVILYRWLAALTPEERTERRWNGKHGEIWRWRWVNQIPLRAGDDALLVNWCDLQITHEASGDILYHNSWATNHQLQSHRVEDVCTFGRTRWKIENEGMISRLKPVCGRRHD